jgi:hypothetical protein
VAKVFVACSAGSRDNREAFVRSLVGEVIYVWVRRSTSIAWADGDGVNGGGVAELAELCHLPCPPPVVEGQREPIHGTASSTYHIPPQ